MYIDILKTIIKTLHKDFMELLFTGAYGPYKIKQKYCSKYKKDSPYPTEF